jgi:hypothetical protein
MRAASVGMAERLKQKSRQSASARFASYGVTAFA